MTKKTESTDPVLSMTMARSAWSKFQHVSDPSDKAKKAAEALREAMDKAGESLAKKREALAAALEK